MMNYKTANEIIQKDRFPVGWVTVRFDDKDVDLPIQLVLILLPVWEIYINLNLPVLSKHIYLKVGPFGKSTFVKMLTEVYLDILENYNDKISRSEFIEEIWQTANHINDFGIFQLNEHHCGMSLVDLCKIYLDPLIQPIVNVDLDETKGTVYIERTMENANANFIKSIGTRGLLKDNILLEYQEAGVLNSKQIPQVMIAFGLRTEVSDKVIGLPVTGSSLTGMKDICELAVEHQAARKSVYYNKEAIRKSQYSGRKWHILCCSIEKIYEGDCGTQVTLPFEITAANCKKCIGKNIVDDNGNIFPLTRYNIDDYIDKTVNMRSAITCRHTNGVCEVCAGLIHKNLVPGMNIGINSAANFVANVSQMILSTKHFNSTKSQLYQIPYPASKYIEKGSAGFYFKPNLLGDNIKWSMGISLSDIRGNITDLHHITEELPIPEERYSELVSFYIKTEHGEIIEIPLSVEGQSPFLTIEFLLYMKSRYNDLEVTPDCVWIPMNGCKRIPIMRTTIVNDSMMGYVNLITDFVESGKLTKYKDASKALFDFSNLVFDKVFVNIFHVEVMLKAHLVTNKNNWSIPIVEDPTNVTFSKTVKIISNRTISGALSLQGHRKFFANSKTYTTPHESGPFDNYYDL